MAHIYRGKIVDVVSRRIFNGAMYVENDKIVNVEENSSCDYDNYIIPGFIDSHIHIESSMLIPSEFAKLAVKSGTISVVADPHEIANVLGFEGVKYMVNDGKEVPFKFYFSVPSCVPATPFETSGATINSQQVGEMIKMDDFHLLGEMMDYPGVINNDEETISKIRQTLAVGKVVDGHAPYISGEMLRKYTSAGITTDHECDNEQEAIEKIDNGMDILIREGSAARNFDSLIGLLKKHPNKVMFCSDDKHPDSLSAGHINKLAKRAVAQGYDVIDVLRACSLNPVRHYKLSVGLLQKDDNADFVIVDNLSNFNILSTYVDGVCVYDTNNGYSEEYMSIHKPAYDKIPNRFNANKICSESLTVSPDGCKIHVIGTSDGNITTQNIIATPKIEDGFVVSDINRDIIKIVVYNRYTPSVPQVAFVHGFNLKQGAIASTIAHDSHNIIAIGTNDDDLTYAINQLIECKGGIIAGFKNEWELLPLPVAGLMSICDGEKVAGKYNILNDTVAKLGCLYKAPFMTLSFLALLVIPELKLSDKGLFDSKEMKFISLFVK
ncbi:adenine deaminase [Xylanibacter oryzae]|uniref:adenine deaminase n=1 Tax=Xylanibacter oryzae TaxID=185293 RepID=UPI0004ADDEFE|nr:adenine deaminase [Xylanibacter oryzae]